MALQPLNGRLIAVCDECGPDYWYGPYGDKPPTFADFDDGVRRLTGDYDWRISKDAEGLHMLCTLCAAFEDCVRRGRHDPEAVRSMCATCGIPCEWDGVPDGHPDSTTADLSDEQEELLAALDAEIAEEAT